jgi:hypothetical protein
MVRSLLEFGQDRLYYQKCRGVSLRQIPCNLIAGCQDFTEQVSECRILSAAHECLSLIK